MPYGCRMPRNYLQFLEVQVISPPAHLSEHLGICSVIKTVSVTHFFSLFLVSSRIPRIQGIRSRLPFPARGECFVVAYFAASTKALN